MEILEKLDQEIIHHSDNEYHIFSKYRNIYIKKMGKTIKVELPEKNFPVLSARRQVHADRIFLR